MSSFMSGGASFLRRMVVPSEVMSMFERGTRGQRPVRADKGIWGGKRIGHGNQVSWADNKHRRTWRPNVQSKRLWSDSFQCMLKLSITTNVLKNIDKEGGLDNYLVNTSGAKMDSALASDLKKLVIEQRRRLAAGEESLPLPKIARPPREKPVYEEVLP